MKERGVSFMKKGYVQWFDKAGEGMIICPEDGFASYYVHYSAIENNEKFKMLNKNSFVEFNLYENLYMKQVDIVKSIEFESDAVTEILELLMSNGLDLLVEKLIESNQ